MIGLLIRLLPAIEAIIIFMNNNLIFTYRVSQFYIAIPI